MTETLIAEALQAALPTPALTLKLRSDPVALRRVLDHHCGVVLSMKEKRVPFAPLWIQGILHGDDQMKSVREQLTSQGSSVCGKALTARAVAFKCLSCGSDPTCIMCSDCFQRSPCRNHDYRMVHSGGGMCDCGDPTAWKAESFCDAHKGSAAGSDPLARLPSDLMGWLPLTLKSSIRFVIRCFNAAIIDASPDAASAGEEPLVRAAQLMLTRLEEFSRLSDASRRLIAVALASPGDGNDVDTVPRAPVDSAIGHAESSDDDDAVQDDERFETSSDSSNASDGAGADSDADEDAVLKSRREAASVFSWLAPDDTQDDAQAAAVAAAAAADPAAQASSSPRCRGEPRYTLLDQIFLLDMASAPKSAKPILEGVAKLCAAVGIDTEFRKAYLRAYAATAWHQGLRQREQGTNKRAKIVYLKSGKMEELAVQVLTVGPIVNTSLLPAAPGGPTLLASLLGAQLSSFAARAKKITTTRGRRSWASVAPQQELLVERRGLRRRVPFAPLYHMRYVSYTSVAPCLVLTQRHLARALFTLLAGRQGSEYRIERSQQRRDMDSDMWDIESIDVCMSWILHDRISAAVGRIVTATVVDPSPDQQAGPSLAEALQLPPEFIARLAKGEKLGELEPPVDLGVPRFDRLVARANDITCAPKHSVKRTAVAEAVMSRLGHYFADIGDFLALLAEGKRLGKAAAQCIEVTTSLNATAFGAPPVEAPSSIDNSAACVLPLFMPERRVSIPKLNLLTEDTPFTLHLGLSRMAVLHVKAIVDGVAKALAASPSRLAEEARSNSVLASIMLDGLFGASQNDGSEKVMPYVLDAALSPYLCLAQYIEQQWRTDFCAVHKHINLYYAFLTNYNQELDLYTLQLLTAAFGARYVASHLLTRFGWGATDAKTAPAGYWHYLRLCLSIATDTCKTTALDDGLVTRVVHALARRQLKRSDMDRIVSSYELDDDQKQLAMDAAIEKTLKAVAVVDKRKDGNVYRLKPEAWAHVNPYHGAWTPFDSQSATENFSLQNKQHFMKVEGKVPVRPVVFAPTKHNPLLHRVVEVVHTTAVMSVAVGTLLMRLRDSAFAGKAKPPVPPAPAVTTAIDTLSLALATAKAFSPEGTRDWQTAYEAAIDEYRHSACYIADPAVDNPAIARLAPVSLQGTDGLLHKVLRASVTVIKVIGGATYKLADAGTVAALLQQLVDDAEKQLEDIPAHQIAALKSVIKAMAEPDIIAAEGGDAAQGATGAGEVDAAAAEAAKKAALKKRQEALMAKLRNKTQSSTLVASAAAATAPDSNAADAATAASSSESAGEGSGASSNSLHLGDCMAVFETHDNRCVFCAEVATTEKPLCHLFQRATSNVLQQLFPGEDAAPAVELTTGHLNCCGHMAHEHCFEQRVTHVDQLRNRTAGLTQVQAYFRGLHFKGVRYLTPSEALCPMCSRAVSILAPAASTAALDKDRASALAHSLAAAVTRTAIGSPLVSDTVAPMLKRLRAEATPPPTLDAGIVAWAAVRAVSQQCIGMGVHSSCGRATTIRSFAGLNSVVRAARHHLGLLAADQQQSVTDLLQGEARQREPHAVVAACIVCAAWPLNESVERLKVELLSQICAMPSVNRAQLRAAVIVRMSLTNEPLPLQKAKLNSATSMEDLSSALDFKELDASIGDDGATEASRLAVLARYLGMDATEDPALVSVDAYRAGLIGIFTKYLPARFNDVVHRTGGAGGLSCGVCGTATPSLVMCLGCSTMLCSRNAAKPELKVHATTCGAGSQVFLELQTTRLVVVQAFNQRATSLPPLFLDKNGEPDVGLRRGLPLHLDADRAADTFATWVSGGWDHLTSALHEDTWLINTRPI